MHLKTHTHKTHILEISRIYSKDCEESRSNRTTKTGDHDFFKPSLWDEVEEVHLRTRLERSYVVSMFAGILGRMPLDIVRLDDVVLVCEIINIFKAVKQQRVLLVHDDGGWDTG